MIDSTDIFLGNQVIVSEKFDGECTSMYNDHIHARSLDSRHHDSRAWVKQFWSQISHEIPDKWRICGENVFAQHSIQYDNLPSYFLGFSVWNERNECLAWDETLEWFEMLGITPVATLYSCIYTKDVEQELQKIELDWETHEGYVIRNAHSFHYKDFRNNVAKYVRKDHVQTIKHHWMGQPVVPNNLA